MTTSINPQEELRTALAGTQARSTVNIQDKVVLLLLTLRAPGNERTVRDKSILSTDAADSRLHIGKKLLVCAEQKAISILDGQMRDWVQRMALPSPFKAGTHVIALDLLTAVDKGLVEYQAKRAALVNALAAVYDTAKAEAKQALGELYVEGEYLSVEELKQAYGMTWQYVTLAPPDQMQELSAEIFERERARLQDQWDGAIDSMRDALRVGLAELVDDMVNRISDDKKFKPTKLLNRFEEFLATFDARNVTNDEELAALAQQARALLAGVDTENLIKSKDVRERVREGFQAAQLKLGELETTSRKARRITFEEE